MEKKRNKKNKILSIMTSIFLCVIAIAGGYVCGNLIASKRYPVSTYANIDPANLRDDIESIDLSGKTPADFNGAVLFQIAEKVQEESRNYEIIGIGTIQTSLGIQQSSYTLDKRTGDDLYFKFVTYSSLVKVAKQSSYQLGGNVIINDGNPKDAEAKNVNWTNTYNEYTWEGYKEEFGKYANHNCSYIVSTKTATSCSEVEKDGDLYKCSIELDTTLGCVVFAIQIGANMGVDPETVTFNKVAFTFWVDENFRFVKQEKFESYTVPYMGVNVTLDGNINLTYAIK